MYILNPLTGCNEDVPVVLLCYGEVRKFIQRPGSYKELILAARDKLHPNLDLDISIQVSTLDICKGRSIEIDESAYEHMLYLLDEITLVTHKRQQDKVREEQPSYNKQVEIWGDEFTSREVLKITRRITLAEGDDDDEQDDDELDIEDDEHANDHEYKDTVATYQEKEGHVNEIPTTRHTYQHGQDTRERAFKQESQYITASKGWKGVGGEVRHQQSAGPQAFDTSKKTKADRPPIPVPKPEESPITPERPVTYYDPMVSVPQAPETDNPRFSVIISGPLPDQQAEFMTRGKHPVRKVLAGACRTFGLDLGRAHLYLVLRFECKDGTHVKRMVECLIEDTVAGCGIKKHSRLVIWVDENDKNEHDGNGEVNGSKEEITWI